MHSYVVMGRNSSMNGDRCNYHEVYLIDDVVVDETLWHNCHRVPSTPSKMVGKTAQQLRESGFVTRQIGSAEKPDHTLNKIRVALESGMTQYVSDFEDFLTQSEYAHLLDVLWGSPSPKVGLGDCVEAIFSEDFHHLSPLTTWLRQAC